MYCVYDGNGMMVMMSVVSARWKREEKRMKLCAEILANFI